MSVHSWQNIMFSKNNSISPEKLNQVSTIIGPEATIEGRFNVESSIRVDGKVYGEVKCAGDVTIGKDGYVENAVHSKNLYIAGKVKGNVKVENKVHIYDSGQLIGSAEMNTIVIEENGQFSGKSLMKGSQHISAQKSRVIEIEKNKEKELENEQSKKIQEQTRKLQEQ